MFYEWSSNIKQTEKYHDFKKGDIIFFANDVDKLDIKHGDLVEVTSKVGTIKIKAYPTRKIIKDTLFYVHGFGANSDGLSLAHRNGASDNAIIEDTIEPVFGSAAMHETFVTVKRV